MSAKKTHREVKQPRISARFLADYMGASEKARRTILRGCKYQPIAKLVQHDRAKTAISQFVCAGDAETIVLTEKAAQLRDMMADDDFQRDVLDFNADYIDRYAVVASKIVIPSAERIVPGKSEAIILGDIRVSAEIHFRLRRVTRSNKVRIGAGMLRYSKGRALPPEVGAWQSAFLLGYLARTNIDQSATPETKLCVTVDAYTGATYLAPGDSVSRFQNMEAACATIAERWDNIPPPPGAVL